MAGGHHGARSRPALIALALLLFGCEAELAADLTEAQADEVLLALDEASIPAEKARERGGDRYRITVARGAVAAGLGVLREHGLPREEAPDLSALFDRGGLIESPEAERARYAAALGGELARSLERIDGVRRARVHLALAPRVGAALDEAPAPSRASVLIEVERGATVEPADVRSLVSGGVHELRAEDVEVVRSAAPPRHDVGPALARVGPFTVSRGDATAMKAVLGASFALNLLLALILVALVRNRRLRPAPSRATPTPET